MTTKLNFDGGDMQRVRDDLSARMRDFFAPDNIVGFDTVHLQSDRLEVTVHLHGLAEDEALAFFEVMCDGGLAAETTYDPEGDCDVTVPAKSWTEDNGVVKFRFYTKPGDWNYKGEWFVG